MVQYHPNEAAFASLKDKVVVVTGGSTGIGAATVTLLSTHGAHVVFGDINTSASESLCHTLKSDPSNGTVTFVPCDVTNYDDLYNLFKTAHDRYGKVDHAISSAGIFEVGKWFDPELTIENVRDAGPGPTAVIDVNVMGTANFCRIAVVFLRDGMSEGEKGNRSLTLLSSVNAFRESPGLYMYQTSKHAIQGLLRALRQPLSTRGIRLNTINPGMTESEMTTDIIPHFKDAGLYWQTAAAVAKFIVAMAVDETMHGKGIYVEGGDGWEFEDGFYERQNEWLGVEPTRRMRINAEAVNKGVLTGGK